MSGVRRPHFAARKRFGYLVAGMRQVVPSAHASSYPWRYFAERAGSPTRERRGTARSSCPSLTRRATSTYYVLRDGCAFAPLSERRVTWDPGSVAGLTTCQASPGAARMCTDDPITFLLTWSTYGSTARR